MARRPNPLRQPRHEIGNSCLVAFDVGPAAWTCRSLLWRRIAPLLARLWRLERRMDGPVQVLWGQKDQWLPAAQGDALAALTSDQPMIRVPGCGHLMQEDAPEAVVAAVMGTA